MQLHHDIYLAVWVRRKTYLGVGRNTTLNIVMMILV